MTTATVPQTLDTTPLPDHKQPRTVRPFWADIRAGDSRGFRVRSEGGNLLQAEIAVRKERKAHKALEINGRSLADGRLLIEVYDGAGNLIARTTVTP